MFKRLFKAIPVALVAVFTLTSCTFIENIIGTILVNAAMNMPILVNGVDLMPENTEGKPALMEWSSLPDAPSRRAEINYLKNVLVVPHEISTSFIGLNIKVEFETTLTYESEMETPFKKLTISLNDLPESMDFDITSALPFPVNIAFDIYIPIGESDLLDDVNSFNDLEGLMESKTQSDIIEATDQEDMDVTVEVKAKSGNTVKTKKFYFNILKPNFGELIMSEFLDSGYLINIFHYQTEGDPTYTNVTNLPTDENEPLRLEYLKDTIVIPKMVTLKDIGDVTVATELNIVGANTDIFFNAQVTKPIAEIAGENDLIEGNVTASTFTPIGEYDLDSSITTVDEFADHIKASVDDQQELKKLYKASQGDPIRFSISVDISVPGESHQDTYYFQLQEPVFDEEILDFAIKSDFVLNKINYNDTSNVMSIADEGQTEQDPIELEYLTETIAAPLSADIDGFDERTLTFGVEFLSDPADENLFYRATKELSENDTSVADADIVVQTLTPVGTFEPTAENDLEAFADEVKDLANDRTEELFDIVNQPASAELIKIRVSVSLPAKEGREAAESKTKDYYIRLIPADIDKEIVDFVGKENALLNLVNFNDISNDPDVNYNNKIESVGDRAKDPDNPLVIEHMTDTLVIPQAITLTEFGNKTVEITSDIKDVVSSEAFDPFIGEKTGLSFEEKYELDAKTITPVGDYNYIEDSGNLDAFGEELQGLTTKELYDHSQGAEVTFTIEVTTKITYNDVMRPDKTTTTEFYIKVVKADIDQDIINYILDNHAIIYKLDILDIENQSNQVPLWPNTPYTVELFHETLIMPQSFTFNDFGEKTINFNVAYDVDDYFMELQKSDYEYEGTVIDALSLTAKGSYEPGGVMTELPQLVSHITNPANQAAIFASNSAEPLERTVVITITVTIDGNPNAAATRSYHVTFVPFGPGF